LQRYEDVNNFRPFFALSFLKFSVAARASDIMNNERWVILAALFAARTTMAFQFQTIGSVGPILVDQLGIDYSRVGTLIGLYLLPGVIISLPGGLLGQHFGAKSVSAFGLFLMNVMATKMVADWFIDRKLTIAMAILAASWPFGIGLGLVEQHIVAAETGYAAVMNSAAAMALSCLFLMLIVYRNPPKPRGDTPSDEPHPNLTGHELRLVLIAGTIWAIYNVGYIVLISFAPEFFAVQGYSASQSSWIVSLLGWMLMPMIAIGGLLAEKTHRPTLIIATGLLVTSLLAMALPFVSAPAALFVLIAFASGLPAGPIMALPATVLRPESRAVGMGAFFACYYSGMAVLPVMAGEVRDVAGDPAAPIFFAAAMILCSLFLLFTFRALQRPRRELNETLRPGARNSRLSRSSADAAPRLDASGYRPGFR
jgi:predicted MFS family arabinose efflux permease